MKKQYSKPGIIIEDFTIAQNISAGCGAVAGGNSLGRPNHWAKETCGWVVGDYILWVESTGYCNLDTVLNEECEGVCYNNPGAGNTIFNS